MWILYSLVSFCAPALFGLGDLLAGSMDDEGTGSVVHAAPFAVMTMTMWATVKADALIMKEERVRRKDACADLRPGFVMWHLHF